MTAPLFPCASDDSADGLLGHHDGLDSWTVNLAADPSGQRQEFVSRHEAAHHQLHSVTPWGVAMLAAGIVTTGGQVAADAWRQLGTACSRVHEIYATYAAVQQTSDGLDVLAGNYTYLGYLRSAHVLLELVPGDEVVADRALDMLLRCAMAPSALLSLDITSVRDSQRVRDLVAGHSPDKRLSLLTSALQSRPQLGLAISEALSVPAQAPVGVERVITTLTEAGIPTAAPQAQRRWITAVIEALNAAHPGRFSVQVADGHNRLADLLDDQQRERVQMHDKPLPLRIEELDPDGRFRVNEYVRNAENVGPHAWLTWLSPAFLRRQFDTGGATLPLQDTPVLGLLSCDRTHGDPHAAWHPFPMVQPGPAAHAMTTSGIAPLPFTTMRTLDATSDTADFRGFEPAFVLLDSDVLAFLTRSIETATQLFWTVIGSTGDRTVEILAFERDAAVDVVYLYVCTSPTSRLFTRWMHDKPQTFRHDTPRFEVVRSHAWALIRHLLGTCWIFDLHGL